MIKVEKKIKKRAAFVPFDIVVLITNSDEQELFMEMCQCAAGASEEGSGVEELANKLFDITGSE